MAAQAARIQATRRRRGGSWTRSAPSPPWRSDNSYCRPEVDESGIIEIRGRPPPGGGADAAGQPVCPQRHLYGQRRRTGWPSSPAPTWRANPPICGRWPSSSSWPRWAALSRPDAAHIGVVDRIFTRIGASDDLSAGQSTFMVEMTRGGRHSAAAPPPRLPADSG